MKTTKGRKECKDKMVMEPEQMEEDRKGMVETKCASLCMSVRVSGIEHTCKLAHVRRLVMGASW